MSFKLFVSDIDGTIIPAGKKMSEENIEAIHKMVDAGIVFTLATGRMYSATLPIARQLKLNVPIIVYNGAAIKTVEGEMIHSECLQPELVREIIKFFREKNYYLQTYSDDVLRYPFKGKYSELYEKALKISGVESGWDGLLEHTENVFKLLSITDNIDETNKLIAEVKAEFGDKIDSFKSADQFAEIVAPGVSKASALKFLAKKFGAEISETVAIGDSENDIPMIKAAGLGIAMGNATDDVKAACDVLTGICEENGFADAVYKYVLQPEKK